MRKAYLFLVLVPAAVAWACGGDDSGTGDGGPDATTDSPSGGDSGKDSATSDGGGQDSSSTDGASDAGQDVQVTLDCFKPADCIDGGEADAAYPPADAGVVCCGNVMGNNNPNACQIEGASTTCKAPSACNTDFTGLLSCSSATVRFCTTNAECTENGGTQFNTYDKCCTANGGDAGSFHVCASNFIAQNSGGKIVCP